MSDRVDLIIDTDPALGIHRDGRPRDVDDGLVIIEALNEPRINLLGITITYGNGTLEDGVQVAGDLVRLKNADVMVHPGARASMATDGRITPAVEFMAETLRTQRCRIAAIGPLTNLGLLIRHAPDCIANIDEVVIVGGRTRGNPFYIGSDGPVRDFNVENDMPAARLLLESGVPVVMAGFELSVQLTVTANDLATIAARGTAAGRYLHDKAQAWLEWWTTTFAADDGFHPWDSAALGWFLHPELYAVEERGWRIAAPDSSHEAAWLETAPDLPGARVRYCTGFVAGGEQALVDAMMARLY